MVVDDEMMIRKALETQLRNKRFSVASTGDLKGARKILSRDSFDLVFLDLRLPDGDGTELLEEIMAKAEAPMVVMMTGFGSVESAVSCMQMGAFDYVVKPFSFDQIEVVVDKVASFDKMRRVTKYYVEESDSRSSDIVGESEPMTKLKTLVDKVAKTEASVLITGENGTGKELVAKELYRNSMLAKEPYIRVNCAAISETLMESEFFGHEKGAFTGATERREGRFELADGGTILLDEISEIAPSLQAKLLRVLQEWEFERVGGNKTIQVKVRVLATTNRDLMAEVKKDNFREDLYYRLSVFPIDVPPCGTGATTSCCWPIPFLAGMPEGTGWKRFPFQRVVRRRFVRIIGPEMYGNWKMRWREPLSWPNRARRSSRVFWAWARYSRPRLHRLAPAKARRTPMGWSRWRRWRRGTYPTCFHPVTGIGRMPLKSSV